MFAGILEFLHESSQLWTAGVREWSLAGLGFLTPLISRVLWIQPVAPSHGQMAGLLTWLKSMKPRSDVPPLGTKGIFEPLGTSMRALFHSSPRKKLGASWDFTNVEDVELLSELCDVIVKHEHYTWGDFHTCVNDVVQLVWDRRCAYLILSDRGDWSATIIPHSGDRVLLPLISPAHADTTAAVVAAKDTDGDGDEEMKDAQTEAEEQKTEADGDVEMTETEPPKPVSVWVPSLLPHEYTLQINPTFLGRRTQGAVVALRSFSLLLLVDKIPSKFIIEPLPGKPHIVERIHQGKANGHESQWNYSFTQKSENDPPCSVDDGFVHSWNPHRRWWKGVLAPTRAQQVALVGFQKLLKESLPSVTYLFAGAPSQTYRQSGQKHNRPYLLGVNVGRVLVGWGRYRHMLRR